MILLYAHCHACVNMLFARSSHSPLTLLSEIQVAGHFSYGVMALSAATFMFWNLFGSRILPAAIHQGNTMSLALQLSCSVLVCLLISHHIQVSKKEKKKSRELEKRKQI